MLNHSVKLSDCSIFQKSNELAGLRYPTLLGWGTNNRSKFEKYVLNYKDLYPEKTRNPQKLAERPEGDITKNMLF
jgi:hypothetical protein